MLAAKSVAWAAGLRALLKTVLRIATPAHWRWSLSCMAATNRRGTTGVLRRSDLRALLRRANANPVLGLDTAALEGAVATFEENEVAGRSFGPKLSSAVGSQGQGLLNVQQITGLLLQLSTESKMISGLFSRYEVGGRVPLAQWLEFTRAEQLERCGDDNEVASSTGKVYQDQTEMPRRKQSFTHAVGAVGAELDSEETLSLLRFSLLLLSRTTRFVIQVALHLRETSHSRATGPPRATTATSWATSSPGSAVPTPTAASCCRAAGISRLIAGTAKIQKIPMSLTGTRSAPSRALTRWPRLSPIVHLSPPRCRSCYRLRCTAIVASRTASQS